MPVFWLFFYLKKEIESMRNVVKIYDEPVKKAAGFSKPAAYDGFTVFGYLFLELNSGN